MMNIIKVVAKALGVIMMVAFGSALGYYIYGVTAAMILRAAGYI